MSTRKVTKADFDTFAKGLNLPEKAASSIYVKFAGAKKKVESVIQSSFLPEDWKQRYIEIWYNKTKILTN